MLQLNVIVNVGARQTRRLAGSIHGLCRFSMHPRKLGVLRGCLVGSLRWPTPAFMKFTLLDRCSVWDDWAAASQPARTGVCC